jgi:hypothetical protein
MPSPSRWCRLRADMLGMVNRLAMQADRDKAMPPPPLRIRMTGLRAARAPLIAFLTPGFRQILVDNYTHCSPIAISAISFLTIARPKEL